MANPAGYLLSHEVNDSFIAVNRLLAAKEDVYWLKDAAGAQFIPAKNGTEANVRKLAQELGLSFEAVAARPSGEALMLRQPRIALWDRYGGSVPSGWTRYVLDKFEFPYTIVYPETLTQNDLARKFDVLIFADDAVPDPVPALRKFLEDGGTILAIGNSTKLASQLDLPVSNALANLTRRDFYVPGSLLSAKVDNRNPLAYGMPEHADFFFDNSPAFRVASNQDVKAVASFDSPAPLRSGWAWGQKYLEQSAAVVEASVGKGKLFLYGPEILFRSQPHGTYKLFFNGIYYGHATAVSLK